MRSKSRMQFPQVFPHAPCVPILRRLRILPALNAQKKRIVKPTTRRMGRVQRGDGSPLSAFNPCKTGAFSKALFCAPSCRQKCRQFGAGGTCRPPFVSLSRVKATSSSRSRRPARRGFSPLCPPPRCARRLGSRRRSEPGFFSALSLSSFCSFVLLLKRPGTAAGSARRPRPRSRRRR